MTVTAPPGAVLPPPSAARPRPALRHPKVAGAVAGVIGVLITAFGAGIAVRFLTKTGLTWTSALGIFTLALGLTLIGYAWVVFWRATRRW